MPKRFRSTRYNPTPECGYEPSGLHFALHVRMGDRRDLEPATPAYFSMLEDFMGVVTQEAARKGHAAPVFHVFSEALYPCPSPENGTFEEFPTWPVERDQVSWAAEGDRRIPFGPHGQARWFFVALGDEFRPFLQRMYACLMDIYRWHGAGMERREWS